MPRYNNSVTTKEDFERELRKLNQEKLNKIARSKSINKQWSGYVAGFDTDYIPNPAHNQNE